MNAPLALSSPGEGLAVRHVSVTYRNGHTALLDASFEIPAGHTIAVVGPSARIGAGSVICAHAVIGPGVQVGEDCAIGPHCAVTHACLGDRVIVHAGCGIGQDGYGYVRTAERHTKIPQVGRVVIHSDVEIGSGTRIDRGGIRDTIIGEGKGGAAGFARGQARVDLEDEERGTRLRYKADVNVGGKLAQVGSRLIQATSRKLSEQFFGSFVEALSADAPGPQAQAVPSASVSPSSSPAPAACRAGRRIPPRRSASTAPRSWRARWATAA